MVYLPEGLSHPHLSPARHRQLHRRFYCDAAKVAIELDGSGHYSPAQSEYDAARDAFLESRGIGVVRIANIDVDRSFQSVCEAIDHAIHAGAGREGTR